MQKPLFHAGRNLALRVPANQYEATVAFYRDIVGLRGVEKHLPHVVFEFGHNHLWIDPVEGLDQPAIWMELVTDDIRAAEAHLAKHGIERCDPGEKLPDGLNAFWIAGPGGTVHLVTDTE